MLSITSLFAVALTALFLNYSRIIIRRRRTLRTAIGDGGDDGLARVIRAQGNLAEYGLLLLALVGLCEANGAPGWWLAILIAAFLLGRASHGYGLLVAEPDADRGARRFRWRVRAMVLTITTLAVAAITLLAMLVLAAA